MEERDERLEAIIAEIVPQFHAGKLNCAEAALGILSRYWECGAEECWPRVATCFGGGICGTQGPCGALTGALMAIGLKKGRRAPGEDKQPANQAGKALMDWLTAEKGSCLCRDLTGMDLSAPGAQQAFRAPGGAHERVCEALVPEICRHLARLA